MPERVLFLELFQPFAQYRNPFTFYYAQTYPLPPKSTIIGMLQNAVGDWYGNKFGVENWWDLKISVHGGFESVFWNYQQLIKGELAFTEYGIWVNRHKKNPRGNIWLPLYNDGLKAQRSPIYQQELFNGHLYIFVKGDENLLEEIRECLENPKKILYLGRSEDVMFIKQVKEIDKSEIETREVKKSLWLTFPTYIKLKDFPITNQKFPVYSIPIEVKFENKKNGDKYVFVKHKSEITKQTKRNVKFETIIYSGEENPVYLDKDKTPVQIEKITINGGDKILKIPSNGWL